MLRRGLVALMAASLLSANAGAVPISFDDIPGLVRANNLHAKGADLQKQAAETERDFLTRSYLPRISVMAGHDTTRTGALRTRNEPIHGAQVQMNVYNGGRDSLEGEILDVTMSAAAAEARRTLVEEVAKARTSYWNLVSYHEHRDAIVLALQANEVHMGAAIARIQAGLAPETDRMEFELHKGELEQDLARVSLGVRNFENELRTLLGVDPGEPVSVPRRVPHHHEERLLDQVFDSGRMSTIQGLTMQKDRARLEEERAARWWAPSIDLIASYSLYPFREREFDSVRDRDEVLIGARMSMNLFDGQQGNTEASKRAIEQRAVEAQLQQTRKEVTSQVDNAIEALRVTHGLIHTSEEGREKAEVYLARTLDDYQKGVKDSRDVLQAAELVLRATTRLIAIRRDYQLARTDLLRTLEIIEE